MTFAWGDSFDCYATFSDAYQGYWDSGVTGWTLTAGRFAGSQALQVALTSANLVKNSGQNDSVHHIVCAFNQSATMGTSALGLYFTLGDGATAQCSIVFNRNGTITLTSGGPGGAVLATYASAYTVVSTWYAFEFEVVVHNSTGSFKVRKNGNPSDDHSTTGIDTAGGNANNYANRLTVGQSVAVSNQNVDDLYWRSDMSPLPWFGDMKCMARAPASDASVQFSRTPTGVLTQTVPTTAVSTKTASLSVATCTPFVAGYSGTITTASVAITTGSAGNMKCAIYADNGSNQPGAVIQSATAPVNPIAVGSNVFTFSPGVAIVKGTTYWLAAITDSSTAQFTAQGSSVPSINAAASYATFPQPNPVPSATTTTVSMSMTYTATPANWQAVAEAQQDATTSYVYDSVPGHADLYGIAAIASTPLTTFAVTTRAYMIKSDAGTRTAAVQLKSGSSTVASPTVVLTPSNWQWAWRHDTTDPATSGAWTAAAVNLIQVGPKCVA